jgi:multiple sugar transport system substrate-binding protein
MKTKPFIKILFLVVWLLAACSSDPVISPEVQSATSTPLQTVAPTSTSIPEATPTRAVSTLDISAEDLGGTELEFWHPWSAENESAVIALARQFNTENPWGITIKVHGYGSDLGRSISDGIPSNVLPSLTVGYSSQVRDWERRGDRIVDINLYIYDPVWGLSPEEQADFYTVFWDQDLADGKRIGLPAYRSAMTLFYNQSWAAELGFKAPPTTPAEFREQVCASDVGSSAAAVGWLASLDSTTALSWLYAFGSDVVIDDGYQFATTQSEDALGFIEDLFSSGCAWRPETPNIYQAFAQRQALFLSSSLTGLGAQTTAFYEAGNSDDWIVIPFPTVGGHQVLTTFGLSYVIFQGTPVEQLASWLFIRWINQPPQQTVWLTATGSISTRASTLELMSTLMHDLPHWDQAQNLIVYSRSEPTHSSWHVARWAVQDAFDQLLRANFSRDQIPELLNELDALLAEIHAQYY